MLKAGNNEIIGMSQMYASKRAPDDGMRAVMENAGSPGGGGNLLARGADGRRVRARATPLLQHATCLLAVYRRHARAISRHPVVHRATLRH